MLRAARSAEAFCALCWNIERAPAKSPCWKRATPRLYAASFESGFISSTCSRLRAAPAQSCASSADWALRTAARYAAGSNGFGLAEDSEAAGSADSGLAGVAGASGIRMTGEAGCGATRVGGSTGGTCADAGCATSIAAASMHETNLKDARELMPRTSESSGR